MIFIDKLQLKVLGRPYLILAVSWIRAYDSAKRFKSFLKCHVEVHQNFEPSYEFQNRRKDKSIK